jgi:DNA-binding response OmpR family regulator
VSGTEFCPYCRSSQPVDQSQEGVQPEAYCQVCGYPLKRGPEDAVDVRPPTILWIDDDQLLLSFCCEALQRHGYRTLVAADGLSGIETAKSERPDLIILDILMPNMSGLEVCRRLRNEPGLKETPIILLTALQGPDLGVKGRQAGATSTIRKPFGPEHIINAIERILGRKAAAPKL